MTDQNSIPQTEPCQPAAAVDSEAVQAPRLLTRRELLFGAFVTAAATSLVACGPSSNSPQTPDASKNKDMITFEPEQFRGLQIYAAGLIGESVDVPPELYGKLIEKGALEQEVVHLGDQRWVRIKNGFPPQRGGNFAVLYNPDLGEWLKVAPQDGAEEVLKKGTGAMVEAFNHFGVPPEIQRPGIFEVNVGGNKYLAMKSPHYGPTLEQLFQQGKNNPQAITQIYEMYKQACDGSISLMRATGYKLEDNNLGNWAPLRDKKGKFVQVNGKIVVIPLDPHTKGVVGTPTQHNVQSLVADFNKTVERKFAAINPNLTRFSPNTAGILPSTFQGQTVRWYTDGAKQYYVKTLMPSDGTRHTFQELDTVMQRFKEHIGSGKPANEFNLVTIGGKQLVVDVSEQQASRSFAGTLAVDAVREAVGPFAKNIGSVAKVSAGIFSMIDIPANDTMTIRTDHAVEQAISTTQLTASVDANVLRDRYARIKNLVSQELDKLYFLPKSLTLNSNANVESIFQMLTGYDLKTVVNQSFESKLTQEEIRDVLGRMVKNGQGPLPVKLTFPNAIEIFVGQSEKNISLFASVIKHFDKHEGETEDLIIYVSSKQTNDDGKEELTIVPYATYNYTSRKWTVNEEAQKQTEAISTDSFMGENLKFKCDLRKVEGDGLNLFCKLDPDSKPKK